MIMNPIKISALPGVLLTVLLLSGCSSIVNAHRQKADLMNNYVQGQRELAEVKRISP